MTAVLVQACVLVASVPAPAVHADAVPAAKRTSEVGDSMDVGESAEKGAAISRGARPADEWVSR